MCHSNVDTLNIFHIFITKLFSYVSNSWEHTGKAVAQKICAQYREHPENEIIDLTGSSFFSRVLKIFMTGKSRLETRADQKEIGKLYTDCLKFSIPYRNLDRGRIFIEPNAVVLINNLFFSAFHEMLLDRILYAQEMGIQEKEAIMNFMRKHGIEPDVDLNFDTVKKANYRLRESKNIDHFYSPRCLSSEVAENQFISK